MALTYGFYNSLNQDRLYNAEHFSAMLNGVINDGVFMGIGDQLMVIPNSTLGGMNIIVGSGRAWFDGTWTNNDADYPLVVPAAGVSLHRIDAIVLETNKLEEVRANSIKIVSGTPGSSPAEPTLTNTETVNQYPLALIYVAANTTTITAGMITNKVGMASCPFVTGILDTMSIDSLIAQWESEFDTWFTNLQNELDSNQVTNLQAQIDALELVLGPPLDIAGAIHADGNIDTDLNLIADGNITAATGVVTGGTVASNGAVTAAGNISGVDINASGDLHAGSGLIVGASSGAVDNGVIELAEQVIAPSATANRMKLINEGNKFIAVDENGLKHVINGKMGVTLCIDNGDSVITTGTKVTAECPYGAELLTWTITSMDLTSGSISVILEIISYANFSGGTWTTLGTLTMTSAVKATGTFSAQYLAEGSIIRLRIATAPTSVKKVAVSLKGMRFS